MFTLQHYLPWPLFTGECSHVSPVLTMAFVFLSVHIRYTSTYHGFFLVFSVPTLCHQVVNQRLVASHLTRSPSTGPTRTRRRPPLYSRHGTTAQPPGNGWPSPPPPRPPRPSPPRPSPPRQPITPLVTFREALQGIHPVTFRGALQENSALVRALPVRLRSRTIMLISYVLKLRRSDNLKEVLLETSKPRLFPRRVPVYRALDPWTNLQWPRRLSSLPPSGGTNRCLHC